MIKFGIREKKHTGEEVINVLCKNCGHMHHVSFGISRYFHLFWVPLFVTSRQVGLRCSNCNRTTLNADMPYEEQQRAKRNIFTVLNSAPLHSGSVLLLILMALLYFAHLDNEKEELTRIRSPQVHDVYFTDLSELFPDNLFGEYIYGAIRIRSINDTGIVFVVSKESFNDTLALSKLITTNGSSNDFYGDKTLVLSKDDVINLYNAETIRSVTRDFRPETHSKTIEW